MLYVNDSSRIWHVAKTGNDGNSGHAGQYPVNLANDAKLTIGAAVTAASSGDTIIIWPGDYDESVDAQAKSLHFVGTSRTKSKIIYSGDGRALQLGSDSSVNNLHCESSGVTANCAGLRALSKSNIWVENCNLVGGYDGLALSGCTDITVIGCRVVGKYDACTVSNSARFLIKDSKFYADGTYNTTVKCRALVVFGANGIIRNCSFTVARSDTSNQDFGGIDMYLATPTRGFIVVSECVFYVAGGETNTGKAFGIRLYHADSLATVFNSVFYVSAEGTSAVYHLYAFQGKIIVANSAYDGNKTYGTVVQADSGWANALAAALFVNGAANKLKIDAAGRVDVGDVKGADAELLTKAAKVLLNKAEQNKLTGEIRYYDDDGQTAILTHTPDENESSFTRMPS
jgi:predicted DNA binding protein